MLQSANFISWDFAHSWIIYNGLTDPLLQSFMTPLAVTANNATQTYNGQPYSGGNGVTYSSAPTGNLLGTVNYTGTSQGAVNVGNYIITPGGLYSNQQGYIISYAGGTLTVTAAPLMVTANAQTMVYGSAVPALTYIETGLVNGDTLTGALATTATVTSNVGPYAITQGTLANSNYSIAYTGANLTVTAAPLTVTANAQTMAYGSAVPALTYVSSGLVNGDTLTGALATTATVTSSIGPYAITQGTLAASANYALSYVGANLTVTAAPLTVTANAQSRIYGAANPALTYIETGLVNGDTLSGLLATTATVTSNVGPYAIIQGTLAASANYALSYVGANLAVTAAPLTVTANAQTPEFPSYFVSNDFLSTAVANLADDPDAPTCLPAGVLQSLHRYGRVDLTGGNAASCKRSF
jgi:hypothetical protein